MQCSYTKPTITVCLEPEGKTLTLPRPKSVLQLLRTLQIRQGSALVIRDGGLLTQDREILPGDHIIIRNVVSSG